MPVMPSFATSVGVLAVDARFLEVGLPVTLQPDQFVQESYFSPEGIGEATREFDATLRTIRLAVTSAWPDQRFNVVMNPLSGINGGLVNLFPEAGLFVGLDAHPFLGRLPSPTDKITAHPVAGRDFSMVGTIDSFQNENNIFAGQFLVGALSSSVDGFRLRRVDVFETREKRSWKVWWRYLKNLSSPAYETSWRWARFVHGLIEYDSGEGTPLRQYLHINTDIFMWDLPSTAWWFSGWNLPTPDVVVIKGTQDLFSPGARHECTAMKRAMIDWLYQSNGVLIEGRHRTEKDQWEFSEAQASTEPDSIVITGKTLRGLPFSYGHDVRATRFQGFTQL